MALGTLDRRSRVLDQRARKAAALGLNMKEYNAKMAAERSAYRAARKKADAPFQKRLNALHKGWVAMGMPVMKPGEEERVGHMRAEAFEMTPAAQYRLAFFIAENLNFRLVKDKVTYADHPLR